MGKKQHQKDKLYLTATEWRDYYGGFQAAKRVEFSRIPFNHCSISFQPCSHPYCAPDGAIFDLENILRYLKKYGTHPITGEPLSPKSLVKLNFYKNANGKEHCPVTYKVFNENSKIVAIKVTGNVYSYEAIEELNYKTQNFRDLLNNEPFKRSDVIVLQDPSQSDRFDAKQFHHVKFNHNVDDDEKGAKTSCLNYVCSETAAALEELNRTYVSPKPEVVEKVKVNKLNAASISTGRLAASLTSTAFERVSELTPAVLKDEEIIWSRLLRSGKKAYVRIVTNLGDLNFELHADIAPRTCHNFILLSGKNYYDNVSFHRSIKHFILQGGDPTGTGYGGESAWHRPFEDELTQLKHDSRGVLSMANSGPNSNNSQFFITYRPCNHLNGKHSIFGRLVGGFEVLSKIEAIPTDDKDKPLEEVTMLTVKVFVNPFEEVEKQLNEDKLALEKKESETPKKVVRPYVNNEKCVGKYLKNENSNSKRNQTSDSTISEEYALKKKAKLLDISKRNEIDCSKW